LLLLAVDIPHPHTLSARFLFVAVMDDEFLILSPSDSCDVFAHVERLLASHSSSASQSEIIGIHL
jgi:hypothetical protein